MLDLRQVRCFIAVAEELSFGAAAARLHVAQPALTRTIKKLEDRIGARLLDRDTRNVRLTEIGRVFLGQARSALEQIHQAERATRDMVEGRSGRIRIGYMNFVTHGYLAPLLKGFCAARPQASVDLHYLGTEQQRAALLEGDIDVALMLGPFSAAGVRTHTLREEELMVVMPHDHPLGTLDCIRAQDLRGVGLVFGNDKLWSVYRRVVFSEFDRCGVSPRIEQEAPTPSAIFALVAAGIGVTIFPRAANLYYHDWFTLRPFTMTHSTVTTVCAWRTDNDNRLLEPFLALVRSPGHPLAVGSRS